MRALSLGTDTATPSTWLKRTSFAVGGGTKDEDWLQDVLFVNSDLIPIAEIIPGTGGFVPICRELTIPKAGGSVYLDIFGVTPEGKPVLIECKLWRNPQARREVIAQTLEYASLMRRWSFGDLTAQVNKKLATSEANPLFRIVTEHYPEVQEGQFVDQVSQALKTGDFVLIIAGDGIRSDVHAIADHLNQSSGLNSRMALVEFQLWESATEGLVIIPTIQLRTELVQHRVFVTDDGSPIAFGPPEASQDDADAIVDPDREASKSTEKAFWQAFIDRVQFEHPDQPKPRHGGQGWVRMQLPEPAGWMTAFRTKDGRGGLFIRFKGEDGELLLAEFEAAKQVLDTELGYPLSIETKKREPFEATVSINFDGNSRDDDAYRAWLLEAANKTVSVLRPFLSQVA